MRLLVIVLVDLLASGSMDAQQVIPTRDLSNVAERSAPVFQAIASVHELGDGSILVNDPKRRRITRLSADLRSQGIIADSGGRPNRYGAQAVGLIRFRGDSTLLVDAESRSAIVLDAAGVSIRALALPRVQDAAVLANALIGLPRMTSDDRLVYRGAVPGSAARTLTGEAQAPVDSAPIVSASFELRRIDTLAWVRVSTATSVQVVMSDGRATGLKAIVNPLKSVDDWVVTRDGSVAIVRGNTYSIDWITPDRQRRTTGRMPFPWRRLTDQEKTNYSDSAVASVRRSFEGAGGGGQVKVEVVSVPLSEIPDYIGAVAMGTTREAPDGTLWILPSTSTMGGTRKVYDIVARSGAIIERVRLPEGRTLVGFARSGDAFLASQSGADMRIERVRVRP